MDEPDVGEIDTQVWSISVVHEIFEVIVNDVEPDELPTFIEVGETEKIVDVPSCSTVIV